MPHAFLIDLTKRFDDPSQVITDIREYSATYSPIAIEWVARSNQKQFLESEVVHEGEPSPELTARIKDLVLHMSQNGTSGSTIHVLSYEGYVLAAVSNLNGPECCVVGHPIRSIEKNAGRISASEIRPGLPTIGAHFLPANGSAPRRSYPGRISSVTASQSLSLDEGIILAKRVLLEGGHTSREAALHQNALRPQMCVRDSRAYKNQLDQNSRLLISNIVSIGIRDGWLHREVFDGHTGYEYIWIDEGLARRVPIHLSGQLQPQKLLAPIPPKVQATEAVSVSLDQPKEISKETESTNHVPAPKQGYRDTAPGQMEFFLRDEEIGSPASARPFLFAAVRTALTQNPIEKEAAQLWAGVSLKLPPEQQRKNTRHGLGSNDGMLSQHAVWRGCSPRQEYQPHSAEHSKVVCDSGWLCRR